MEQPDGSITTSDVFAVLTYATAAVAKLAEEHKALREKAQNQANQVARVKKASLEERLAKRRAAARKVASGMASGD